MSLPVLLQPDPDAECCGCPTTPCAECGGCSELGDSLYVTISGITTNGCTNGILSPSFPESGEITADGLNALFEVTGSYGTGWGCSLSGVGSTSTVYQTADCDGDELGTGNAQPPYTYNSLGVSCSDGVLTVILTFMWSGTAPTIIYQWKGSGVIAEAIPLTFLPPTSDPGLAQALSNGTVSISETP